MRILDGTYEMAVGHGTGSKAPPGRVVSCAGGAAWKPLAQLTEEDFAMPLGNKLMGRSTSSTPR